MKTGETSTDFCCSGKGLNRGVGVGGGKLSHGPTGPSERGLRGRRVYAGSGSAPPTRGSWERRGAGAQAEVGRRIPGHGVGLREQLQRFPRGLSPAASRLRSRPRRESWEPGGARTQVRAGLGLARPRGPGWTHRRLPPAPGDAPRLNFRT